MTDTPERDKLVKLLSDTESLHVTWGPEAHTLTPEERAKAINEMLDSAEKQYDPAHFDWKKFNSAPETDLDAANRRIAWMLDDMLYMADAMTEAFNIPDVRKSDAFCALDLGLLHSSNHVPRSARKVKP